MEIHNIISSGVLEQYALGTLPPTEKEKIDLVLKKSPEARSELGKIELTLEKLAFHQAVQPSVGAKGRFLAEFDKKQETVKEQPKSQPAPVVVQRNPSLAIWKYAVAASIALAVLGGTLAFYYRGLYQKANGQLALMSVQGEEMAIRTASLDRQVLKYQTDLDVISQTSTKKVPLKGLEKSPSSEAIVFWANSNEVYLLVNNLPSPSAGKQYQLWGIVGGKPVDAGLVQLGQDGLLKMKTIEGAVAFAITLENEGGSPVPTLSEMYVVGNVTT